MHRKIRDQSALKLKNTIILYSPEIRQLLKVNSVEGQGKGLRSKGRECSSLSSSATVCTATNLLQGGKGVPTLLGWGRDNKPGQ